MEDIYTSIPEACDDKDCPVQYHIAHYWAYDDGTWSVCDSDGNHDDIDGPPTAEEERAAWRDYWHYVLRTGTDPVGEEWYRASDATPHPHPEQVIRKVARKALKENK